MSHRTSTQRRTWKERALSLLLAAALIAGLAPGLTLPASAEHWADAYLDQLVDWGVMRADQTANPDADLTRAEFFAIINRAYGYTETGYIPFVDVLETDWFRDDISIAYTAGYMAGTSPTTASPNDTLTREQAFCILGRNMMLKDAPGESLAFSDSRDVSEWARGTIKAAADNYIVSGYPDNTLHPQDSISKGQMAVLITQCLGNPIRESGTYDLGGVFGNVTITAPNVTLRNATISGDLYISGGVGLGGVKLENVDVLGRIVVSGTGESEDGGASVIMRNVTAEELLVDNMRNKTVTVRADGITDIARTVVRTNAYLEDNNTDDKGLMHIEVDGDPGLRLTLAGRIKEVVNKTPASYIQAAKGTVAKLTVDEAATNSTVQLDRNTKISVVNLDVATSVLGDGDIDQLNVNAPGSVVTMLPDKIYIRPGLNANIAGVIMDYQAAEEGSLDPRLLSGYPAAKDIAPTGFRADFAGNKKGTIYWAVSYLSDGSVEEDDLISPPSYGNKAIANGSVEEPTGGEEVSAQVGNLVVGGSYYLSAILVDEQKERSPVKVISFSTPDNTVPAFAQGYPQMSRVSAKIGESIVTVMPTKSCKLYYALLPQGAKAPTANELKAAAVTGNLGYGVRDVTKNTESVFPVNSQELEELKTYVLYLWLTDADGVNSSNVISLSFTTPDVTSPEFNPEPTPSGNPGATNVPLIVGLTEPGTVYWVAVPRGTAYPLPHNGVPDDNVQDAAGVWTGDPTRDWAKSQVKSGRLPPEGGRAGSVRVANANTDVAMNITGLARETAYDLYYVAVDNATPVGNYSERVKKLTINTLDVTPPTVRQSFTVTAGLDDTSDPLVSTDIKLIFSEDVISYLGHADGQSLLDIWAKVSVPATAAEGRGELYELLSNCVTLYQYTGSGYTPVTLLPPNSARPTDGSSWIDFSKATVLSEKGEVIVTLPYSTTPSDSAHRLTSGVSYYFEFQNLADNSRNLMGTVSLDVFTTVFAQVSLSQNVTINAANGRPLVRNLAGDSSRVVAGDTPAGAQAEIDYMFQMQPLSTDTVDAAHSYDLELYTGTSMAFDLYCRITDPSGDHVTSISDAKEHGILAKSNPVTGTTPLTDADDHDWFYLGNSGDIDPATGQSPWNGVSVNGQDTMGKQTSEQDFPQVQTLTEGYTYDFVISLTRLGSTKERAVWSANNVTIEAYVMAGHSSSLVNLTRGTLTSAKRDEFMLGSLTDGGLRSIGITESRNSYLVMRQSFTDSRVPNFNRTYPMITPGDSFARVKVSLDRAGTLYYAVGLLGEITTTATGHPDWNDATMWNKLPKEGQTEEEADGALVWVYQDADGNSLMFDSPNTYEIREDEEYEPETMSANRERTLTLSNLLSNEKYIVYFVLKGDGAETSQVYAYAFETIESSAPKIALNDDSGKVELDTSYGSVESSLDWVLFSMLDGQNELDDKIGPIDIPATMGGYRATYGSTINPLEALTTDYDAGNAYLDGADIPSEYGSSKYRNSIFDVLATDGQKRALYTLIQNTGNNSVVSHNAGEHTMGPGYTTDAEWLKHASASSDYSESNPPDASMRFLILVMGRNYASTPPDDYITDDAAMERWVILHSFRALDDVKITDPVAPKLMGPDKGDVLNQGVRNAYITYDKDSDMFSGSFALYFDKALYWMENANSRDLYQVKANSDRPSQAANPRDFGSIGLLYQLEDQVGGSANFTIRPIGDYSYTITFSGVKNSLDTIHGFVSMTLLEDGLLCNVSGITTDAKVNIILNLVTVDPTTGSQKAQMEITYVNSRQSLDQSATILSETTIPGDSASPAAAAATAPELVGVTATNVKGVSSGVYSMDLNLTFDQALYTKTGNTTKAVSGAALANKNTVRYNGASLRNITSSGSGKSYTLTLEGVQPGTITLPSQTFYDATGQASTTGVITIEISKTTDSSNSSSMAITTPQVTVSFGSFEQTNDLTAK